MNTLLASARQTLFSGAEQLGLSQSDIDRLLAPQRSLQVEIPLELDGSQPMLRGWRVQHNLAVGPGKGGVRYSPNVTQAEVTGLATIMTLKNALAGLPFGGAKGGVQVDTSLFDDETRTALATQLAQAFGAFVGPDTDILGPDVGTGPEDMGAFTSAWQSHTGIDSCAVATGKPMDAGGLEARTGATASGCAAAIEVARDRMGIPQDASVAIQGFGALGRTLAELLAKAGHRIVAVSDSGGGIYNADGLDIAAVIDAKEDSGSVTNAEGEQMDSLAVLTADADIVVPAALQSVIDVDLADKITARLLVEGSNAPTTVLGVRRLNSRKITVVPDFAANAGGVIGSFYEWSTNQGNEHQDPAAEIAERVAALTGRMWDRAESDGIDLRTAASALALETVLDAT